MPWLTRPLDYTPKRIVSLNPSITEFLFVAGAGDRVVGRDVFSYRPREALRVPHVASFTSADLDSVKALRPDLIIAYYPVQKELVGALDEIAPVAVVETPADIYHAVVNFRFIAKALDVEEQGEHVAGVYLDLFKGYPPAVEDVLVVFSLGGYEAACSGSFTASALDAAGLRYTRKLRCSYRAAGPELIEAVDPGLIIFEDKLKEYREAHVAWIKRLRCRACRGGVVVTPNDTLAHYGPSLPLDVARVREAALRGAQFVEGVSSVVRPSLSEGWYSPYL
ncbi:MAG: ABC transporter substrate-binding protein [Thermoproteus sp. AZ2]|jgi:ABC-type Fe3+-hydroxamate transport system substrate-binding protein|uniref:ABC transporter substrate-binding protein n=1 Tax=Thermoproteus sp. AZ2 TaxID=1609232 RepID=A0ACC6V2Z5_9CREN